MLHPGLFARRTPDLSLWIRALAEFPGCRAARTRGVMCVSGERGPKASERNVLHGKGSGDDRSTSPRSRGDREAGDSAKGKPEKSRSRAEGRERATQGAQGTGTRPPAEHPGPEKG